MFANAGISRREDMTADDWNRTDAEAIVATNILGTLRITSALLPVLRRGRMRRSRAMPLSAYVAEVLQLLEAGDHPAGEVLVEHDQGRRSAEREGSYEKRSRPSIRAEPCDHACSWRGASLRMEHSKVVEAALALHSDAPFGRTDAA